MMQNVKVTQKGEKGPVPARIFFILARNSPTAVVFRRGPSKWFRSSNGTLIQTPLKLANGFMARSMNGARSQSDGSMLVYFAQKIEGEHSATKSTPMRGLQ